MQFTYDVRSGSPARESGVDDRERVRDLVLGDRQRRSEPHDVVAAAREQGLLVLTAGDHVLRLAPPLTVGADEVASALQILGRIFR